MELASISQPSTSQPPVAQPPVDLVINCFERTYRKVLAPGFVHEIRLQNKFPFAQITVLLNNINEPEAARQMAQALVASGEITHFYFVAEHLDHALQVTGMTRAKLGPLPYYTDWALVALTVPGSDWIVHWDADVFLRTPIDWITPSLELMARIPDIATANPVSFRAKLYREDRGHDGDFMLGYGFSDQVFLLRRSEFARPIYHHWVPISIRFPLAHVGPYFEQWVDAYMRVHRRRRATCLPAVFVHDTDEGASYPTAWTMRLRNTLRWAASGILRRFPYRHRYLTD